VVVVVTKLGCQNSTINSYASIISENFPSESFGFDVNHAPLQLL